MTCREEDTHHAGCPCYEQQRNEELEDLRARLARAEAVVEAVQAKVRLCDECVVCDYDDIAEKGHDDGCALAAHDAGGA